MLAPRTEEISLDGGGKAAGANGGKPRSLSEFVAPPALDDALEGEDGREESDREELR